jgi:hypothetical protein
MKIFQLTEAPRLVILAEAGIQGFYSATFAPGYPLARV